MLVQTAVCSDLMYSLFEGTKIAEYRHEFGEVPFIPFPNNNTNTNDLKNKLILFHKMFFPIS